MSSKAKKAEGGVKATAERGATAGGEREAARGAAGGDGKRLMYKYCFAKEM